MHRCTAAGMMSLLLGLRVGFVKKILIYVDFMHILSNSRQKTEARSLGATLIE